MTADQSSSATVDMSMSTAHIRASRVRVVLGWSALAALSYLALLVVRPFLVPLGWAAVFATVFYPLCERLKPRWGAAWSAAAVTCLATVVVVGPLFLAATIFVREALQAAGTLQSALADGRYAWVQRAFDLVQERIATADRVDVASMTADAVRRVALGIASHSGAVLRNIAGFVFDLVVALFAMFFLLRDSPIVMRLLRRLLPMDSGLRERLIGQVRHLVTVSVTASLVVAAVQGVLGGMVFAIVGIDAPVFWGGVMALFCLLPLGAWLIWLPAALLLAVDGSIGRAVLVGALGCGVVSAVDNVLRPALLSGGAQMNGLVILIALLGGISAFGLLGVVLGPIVLVTAIALVNTYTAATEREAIS